MNQGTKSSPHHSLLFLSGLCSICLPHLTLSTYYFGCRKEPGRPACCCHCYPSHTCPTPVGAARGSCTGSQVRSETVTALELVGNTLSGLDREGKPSHSCCCCCCLQLSPAPCAAQVEWLWSSPCHWVSQGQQQGWGGQGRDTEHRGKEGDANTRGSGGWGVVLTCFGDLKSPASAPAT